MTYSGSKFKNFSNKDDDEINLKSILDFFFRNKFQISIFSLLFFILSIAYSYSLKKTWQGKFQIVLNSDNSSQLYDGELTPRISNVLGIAKTNNLKTEVGILKSPSILMPIFEFVKSPKNNSSEDKNFLFQLKKI